MAGAPVFGSGSAGVEQTADLRNAHECDASAIPGVAEGETLARGDHGGVGELAGPAFDVETGPGEFSYPAVIASGEGLALCYTWNRRRIAFVRIPKIRELLVG
jgi:hypothetical protein